MREKELIYHAVKGLNSHHSQPKSTVNFLGGIPWLDFLLF